MVDDEAAPDTARARDDDDLPPGTADEIVAGYRAGLTVVELMEIFHVGRQRVDALVAHVKVERRRRHLS